MGFAATIIGIPFIFANIVEAQVNLDDAANIPVPAAGIIAEIVSLWNSFGYIPEVVMLSLLALWILIWKNGKDQNERIAKKWMSLHINYFNQNFAQVGDDNHALIRDGPMDFYFYLTGRINCRFIIGKIALKPRHDLVTVVSNFITESLGWQKPTHDSVTFEINLPQNLIDSFVFAITPGGDPAKSIREDRFDIQKFTKQVTSQLLPPRFVMHTASNEIGNLLLDGEAGDILKKEAKWFTSLIITSYPEKQPLKLTDEFDQKIILTFNLPSDRRDFEEIVPLGELAINLIDIVAEKCNFRNDTIKSKLSKQLSEVQREFSKAELEKRESELQEKKLQKKKEEEEKIRKLSPEEQRKWEEKEYQKQLKKDMKKRTKRG